MIIRGPEIAAAALAGPRPAGVASAAPAQIGGREPPGALGRQVAAFKTLGIGNTVGAKANALFKLAPQALGIDRDGAQGLERMKAFHDQALATARRENPAITDANARHIAQYETIMAHRSEFPPGAFRLHTELGRGASITTTIPAIEKPSVSAFALSVSIKTATIPDGRGEVSATDASVRAAYAEWS